MTRFEECGAHIQYCAKSKPQAVQSFRRSCNMCCNRGFRIDCDRCGIAYAHERQVEILEAEAIHIAINVIAVKSSSRRGCGDVYH